MTDKIEVKQTWAKPTGPHPEGRPVFSINGKRVSIDYAKKLIDDKLYEPSPKLQAWFAMYYKPKVTIELSIIETNKIADLKNRKKGIDVLIANSRSCFDEQLHRDIQDAQAEYYNRFNSLVDSLSRKMITELGVETA